ncbi:hypothetical protein H2201_005689 [Coniosporium apollinis]|uniref:Heterokaryon incompatibility domain-containing protein n=1 Tax=Coniosporium apollinis TaxID=61459 RepID=A0ABQ9NR99_9PEZI|nr:hypothetical protein H2201_005689 [Coniosporium apollinis]
MRSNLADLEQPGGLIQHLPKIPPMIRDAIQFVAQVGERFLWTDVLCIIQDDTRIKHEQINQMGLVYGRSFATLIAPAAKDANFGLPGVRPNTRLPFQVTEQIGEHRLGTEPPDSLYSIRNGKYHARGWTLQEQLLSPRCLYFTEHQIYLHDNGALHSEFGGELTGVEQDDIRHLNYFWDTSWVRRYEAFEDLAPWEVAFRIYARLIGDFTSRQLSYGTDALKAVAGLLSTLQSRLGGTFLCGLPEAHIDHALLWGPAPHTSPTRNFSFPSWSWAGWVGQSEYTRKPVYLGLSHAPVRLTAELEDLSTFVQAPIRGVGGPKDTPWVVDPQLFRDIHVLSFRASVVNARFFFFGSPAPTISMLQPEPTSAILASRGSVPAPCGVLFHKPDTLMFELSRAHEYAFVLLSRRESGGVSPEFHYDEEHFPTRPWSILNVMLISGIPREAQRMAIGQMHEDAFELACPKKEDILLY